MNRTHLFLALADAPWGELLYAVRIAADLTRRGDRVVFVAPPGTRKLLEGQPVRFEALRPALEWLPQVQQLIASERCASLVLVDLAIAYTHLEVIGLDATFVDQIPIPVIGLDVWNLDATDLLMERGTAGWMLSPHVRDVTRRLIPSPMIRPTGWDDPLGSGVYNSLDVQLPDAAPRAEVRARLGAGPDDRIVVLPTASWQQPAIDPTDPYVARLTRRFPAHVAGLLARLGGDVRVVHVGAQPLPELAGALGARYVALPQLARAEFLQLLVAADLLLSFNVMATTIGTAALAGLPVLLGVNSFGGATVEDIERGLPFSPAATTTEWLRTMAPLHPFRVWPFGLFRFTAAIASGNPCVDMTTTVEVLDDARFVAAASALLRDDAARSSARARMEQCLAAVRALPTAGDVVEHHLR